VRIGRFFRCSKCGEWRGRAFMAVGSKTRNGIKSWCRRCQSQGTRRWVAANPERDAENKRRWRQTKGNDIRRERYNSDPKYRQAQMDANAAYLASHREEAVVRVGRWRREHPDQYRVQARAAAHRRRARAESVGGDHTPEDVAAQLTRQRGRCFYCGGKVGERYHADHVVPLSSDRGSWNGPENIVVSCPKCNHSKHAKDPMDFAGIMF
jgi:5-methylcytosine-specific restriction endonuclease McrA